MSTEPPAVIIGKDGKEMIYIPAGEFLMGGEKKPVYVDAFYIDKYPVTNAEYKAFVDATGYRQPDHWRGGTYPPDKADHPVVQVNWEDAAAYAEWAGKRLPTEEEWEKAARGTDGRTYPWGDTWEANRANTSESGILDTTPVGKYSPQGDSPYGVADMAGNVWEWTASGVKRVYLIMRGGTWLNPREDARCTSRLQYTPRRRNPYVGFRCALSVPKQTGAGGAS